MKSNWEVVRTVEGEERAEIRAVGGCSHDYLTMGGPGRLGAR